MSKIFHDFFIKAFERVWHEWLWRDVNIQGNTGPHWSHCLKMLLQWISLWYWGQWTVQQNGRTWGWRQEKKPMVSLRDEDHHQGFAQIIRELPSLVHIRSGDNPLPQDEAQHNRAPPLPWAISVSFSMCSCGDAEQTMEHILQKCRFLQQLRAEVWLSPMLLDTKLYQRGCFVDDC